MTNRGCDRPAERDLNNHLIPEVADKWRDIGVELLDANSTKALDIIERDHQNDTKTCCRQMFKKWLDTQENASWDQLLEALRSRSVQLNTLANKIENMLVGNASPPATYTSSIDYSDCHDITEGFTLLVAELAKVLESANFPALKRAFKLRIPGGVQLPDDLKAKIKEAKELDDLLEALFESKYWNFADLRLVGVLVMSSGIREAKTLVDKYKEVFFSTKLVDVLNVCTHTVLPPNQHKEYVCRVGSKIDKEPDEITVADLAHYCTALETVIMDINEGSCVLEHAEKGCIELHWLIPIHCRYHAYKSALNNRHKFHSLHLQYLKIETYPVIYDQFTVQPTVLSTLLCSPSPVVSTPAEVIGHYYCFLADNLSNDTFCQIMSSLQLLNEDDRVTLSMLPSEYQRNTSLLDHLLVSDITDICRFCHTLQDAENQKIGYMLVNAIQSIPTDNDMGESLHSESESYQQSSTTGFDKDGEISALPSEMILASKRVQLKFLNAIAQLNTILEKCDSRVFLEACNKLYAYVKHSKAEPLFPSNYITNLDTTKNILMRLSFLWSWHNCSVLRALLEACNCQDGLTLLDEFESQIDLNQPMELFPIPRLSSKMAPSSSSAYTVLSIRSEQYHNQLVPLQYMREVATTLEQMFGISHHALQLLAVQPAPLVMYWMIPNTVVALIGKEIHQHTSALRDNGFLEITAYPNITLFPRNSLSFSLLSYDRPQDTSLCVTSSEDKSNVGMKIEQAKSANLQSELSTKTQELDKLKMKERKLAALYSQSKVELYKVERGLTSGIEWLSTVPLKLCSETEIKIDTIEAKLIRNITTLSRLQSILDEKWNNKNIPVDLTDVKPVHKLKGMGKKGLQLGVEMSGEEMLNTLKSDPHFKSKDSSQKEILDTDKKGSNDDQKDTNQPEMELDEVDVGTLDVIPDGITRDDKPNMADLHSKVIQKQFAINWERLGLKLGLTNDQMEIISYNHKHSPNRAQDCCTAMFEEWLRDVPSPTWGLLSDAIIEIMTGDDIDISTRTAKQPHSERLGKEKPSTPPWTPSEPTLTLAGETFKFSADDLEDLDVLAGGTYGVVHKMKHTPTKILMAMKRIPLYKLSITGKDEIIKFFAQILHRTCPYIVDYYGYLIREGELWICMELMDTSMNHVFKKVYQVLNQTIPEEMIGKIAVAVVNALHYLKKDLNLTYEVMRSSNIVLNKNGDIKLCDLSLLVHSIAYTWDESPPNTHYGAFYMAPEKIDPSMAREECTDKLGVWSFGITLMELALGEFPYKVQNNTFAQLNAIISGDSPRLSREKFSRELCDFVAACLIKDPIMRPGYDQLLMSDYVVKHTESKYDVAEWFKQFIQYLAISVYS